MSYGVSLSGHLENKEAEEAVKARLAEVCKELAEKHGLSHASFNGSFGTSGVIYPAPEQKPE